MADFKGSDELRYSAADTFSDAATAGAGESESEQRITVTLLSMGSKGFGEFLVDRDGSIGQIVAGMRNALGNEEACTYARKDYHLVPLGGQEAKSYSLQDLSLKIMSCGSVKDAVRGSTVTFQLDPRITVTLVSMGGKALCGEFRVDRDGSVGQIVARMCGALGDEGARSFEKKKATSCS